MCAVYRDVKTETILIARLGQVNPSKMTSAVVILLHALNSLRQRLISVYRNIVDPDQTAPRIAV